MDVLSVTPSFSKFLQHLSSDQRRVMVTILVKNGQLNPLMRILAEEGPEVLDHYNRWKEGEADKRMGVMNKWEHFQGISKRTSLFSAILRQLLVFLTQRMMTIRTVTQLNGFQKLETTFLKSSVYSLLIWTNGFQLSTRDEHPYFRRNGCREVNVYQCAG